MKELTMTAKMNLVREDLNGRVGSLDLEGYVLEGRTSKGFLFYNEAHDLYATVGVTVHKGETAEKEGFDATEALLEYEEKVKAREQKELEKAEKAAKREAKKKAESEE